MSIQRHKRGHLLPRVRRAAEKRADLNAEKLIDRLIMLAEQTDALLAQSIVDRDRRSSGILIGEVRRNVIMLGRVVGAPWVDRSIRVADNRVQIAVTSLSTDQLKELIDNLTSREHKRQESLGSVAANGSNLLESEK